MGRVVTFRLSIFGHDVCLSAFRECLGSGNKRLSRLQGWLKLGHMHPPRDLRHYSAGERTISREASDAALQWAFDVLAESMNSSDVHPAASLVRWFQTSMLPMMLWTRCSVQCQPLMASVNGCMGQVQQSQQLLLMQGKSNGCRQWLRSTSLICAKNRCQHARAISLSSDATMRVGSLAFASGRRSCSLSVIVANASKSQETSSNF